MKFVFPALFVLFSAATFALDGVTKTIVSGTGQTNVHRNIRYPIFVDNEGRQIKVDFRSEGVGNKWLKITSQKNAKMTLIGIMKSDVLEVHAVETDEVSPDSISVLKLDAELAWENIERELRKNEVWISVQNPPDLSVNRSYGMAPNQMRLLHTSNLMVFHVSKGGKEFLKAVIALGKKAENGIPPGKIEAYMQAMDGFMELDAPANYKALRQKLLKSQGKCESTVAPLTYQQILDTV